MSNSYAELILVRHGETTWNASGRLQGQAESELNETGKRQAQVVAERLAKDQPHIYAVYSSDLKRAYDTAKMIAEKLSCSKVETYEGLRERHLGNLQGFTSSEARSRDPKAYKAFVSSWEEEPIPGGGESLAELYARTKATLEEIAQENQGRKVVIVTHGGLLRAVHILAKGLPCGEIHNASINVISISDENDWAVRSWGDIKHLKKVGHLGSGFGGDKESG
ncbi:hypothetical protein O6H91_06G048100 [Diphasiastrum complanatum]|uniref:Uncharacterized protein n=3 Tax=Diphasiastrum complanatum TaxID=34168 RepID=A0ACC2DD92_DIPCM|nr:hypothetical protein O6H91_06G048100 [Diphasiastrum complanatum]KAJ7552268.1 hypothetical protein O6H91_06G048100 [Diphasiastrum complanatum]KAJ7552269.1 hypothetical protein O6H91_06G048100 [Diphasiastrum complanatum]